MAATFDLEAHRAEMRRQGWWHDRTFDDLLQDAVTRFPDKLAIQAYRKDKGYDAPVRSMTFAELEEAVAKAAGAFRALGIGAGDVVGVQLPNSVGIRGFDPRTEPDRGGAEPAHAYLPRT